MRLSKYITLLFLAIFCIAADPSTSEEEALQWAATMYPNEPANVLCTSRDTNNDDYVSCSVAIKGHNPIALECGNTQYCVARVRGCRLVPGVIR